MDPTVMQYRLGVKFVATTLSGSITYHRFIIIGITSIRGRFIVVFATHISCCLVYTHTHTHHTGTQITITHTSTIHLHIFISVCY